MGRYYQLRGQFSRAWVRVNLGEYEIDLVSMEQVNTGTGVVRKIKREEVSYEMSAFVDLAMKSPDQQSWPSMERVLDDVPMVMNFAFKMMTFAFKMMDFACKMMNFSFKMMNFAFKMINFAFKMMDFSCQRPGEDRCPAS